MKIHIGKYFQLCRPNEPGAQRVGTNHYVWRFQGALDDLLDDVAEMENRLADLEEETEGQNLTFDDER